MTVVQEVATTYQSDFQYHVCDLLEGLESENTMEDVEYQVHRNNIVFKI